MRLKVLLAAAVAGVAIAAVPSIAALRNGSGNNAAAQFATLSLPAPASVPTAVSEAFSMPEPSGQGSAIAASARRLATNLGANAADLWAFKTTAGSVCFIVTDLVPAGTCVDRFDDDGAPTGFVVYRGEGMPETVAGLVPDDVTAVDLVDTSGARSTLALSHGAFFAQGAAIKSMSALELHHRGGNVEQASFKVPGQP